MGRGRIKKLCCYPILQPRVMKSETFTEKIWNLDCILLPLQTKTGQMLRYVKDDLGLKIPGLYQIPCSCGLYDVGQMGHTVSDHYKKHEQCIRLCYPEQLALVEHQMFWTYSPFFRDYQSFNISLFLGKGDT